MARLLALAVAVLFATIGNRAVLVVAAGFAMGGESMKIPIGLAIYVYGVAACAVWYAVRPFRHGPAIIVLLCSPAALLILLFTAGSAVSKLADQAEDRRRIAVAVELWEEWLTPADPRSVPFLVDGRALVTGTSGIFESTDRGESWTLIAEPFDDWPIERWARVDDTLFAATRRRLYRSDDGGRTWTWLGVPHLVADTVSWTVSEDPRTGRVAELASGAADLYLDHGGHVFRSGDLGESWTLVFQPDRTNLETRALYVAGDTLFLGTFTGGAYRSTDRGDSWTHLAGIENELVTGFATDGRAVYAVVHPDDRRTPDSTIQVLRSFDGGDTWTQVPVDAPPRRLESVASGWKLAGPVGAAAILLTEMDAFSVEAGEGTWLKLALPGPKAYTVPQLVGPHFNATEGQLFLLTPDEKLYRLRSP